MKTLNEMNTEQLTYLKQKWSAETRELDRDIIRAQERLTTRISRQEIDKEELEELELSLAQAQLLLTHLQTTGAPQEMIDNQQGVVDKLQIEVDTESRGTNVLTDEEAYLQQSHIDQLTLQKQYRNGKIVEIDTILVAIQD